MNNSEKIEFTSFGFFPLNILPIGTILFKHSFSVFLVNLYPITAIVFSVGPYKFSIILFGEETFHEFAISKGNASPQKAEYLKEGNQIRIDNGQNKIIVLLSFIVKYLYNFKKIK